MKKYSIVVFAVMMFCASSCISNTSTNKGKEDKQDCRLKAMLDSCLIEQPNAMNNDVTKSILADTIKARLQQFRGDTLIYISDIPFQYEMALEYPPSPFEFESESYKNAGKYVVKFGHSDTFTKYRISDKYEVSFQVFTIMNKETVANLVDGELYYISGIFRDFANNSSETGFVLPSGKCLIQYPTVNKYTGDKVSINLGTMIVDGLTFKLISQQ